MVNHGVGGCGPFLKAWTPGHIYLSFGDSDQIGKSILQAQIWPKRRTAAATYGACACFGNIGSYYKGQTKKGGFIECQEIRRATGGERTYITEILS